MEEKIERALNIKSCKCNSQCTARARTHATVAFKKKRGEDIRLKGGEHENGVATIRSCPLNKLMNLLLLLGELLYECYPYHRIVRQWTFVMPWHGHRDGVIGRLNAP